MDAKYRHPNLIVRLSKLGHDRYEIDDRKIIRRHGYFRRDAVDLARITGWRVDDEMIFDLVTLTLSDGSVLVWFDYDNDLLSILREHVPRIEVAAP